MARKEIAAAYQSQFGSAIAYNTVKSRLTELSASGLVEPSSVETRPATYRYRPPSGGEFPYNAAHRGGVTDTPARDLDSQLSSEAVRLRGTVTRPRHERTPVGYDIDFLDAYQPGTTWYLGRADRERLYDLGQTTYMGQPAGTYARDIMQRLVIDLSWGSSRLEGLRYSRIDTAELLDSGRAPAGASDRDRQLIVNHKAAIEFLVEEAASIAFNRYTIFNLHALLAENLLERREQEGALRSRPVAIGGSVYTPTAIPQLIEERFDTMLHKVEQITDPLEQSFFIMVHLPYLQPFIDVNKRTSRLAANIPLIRRNLCPLSFVDVPEEIYTFGTLGVYEHQDVSLLRDVYIWAYERSCAQFKVLRESTGEPDPIRLNYRAHLRGIVADVVRDRRWPTLTEVGALAQRLGVPDGHRSAVAEEAMRDLTSLRPGLLARYGLRQSEYDEWATVVARQRGI